MRFIINALKDPERLSALLALYFLSYSLSDFYNRMHEWSEIVLFILTIAFVYVMLLQIALGTISIVRGFKRRG